VIEAGSVVRLVALSAHERHFVAKVALIALSSAIESANLGIDQQTLNRHRGQLVTV